MRRAIHRRQEVFRFRLLQLRGRQLAAAADRAYRERLAWGQRLASRRAARAALLEGMCEGCEMAPGDCQCHLPATADFLVRGLRSLAGINPGQLPKGRSGAEWGDWNAGPPGFQKCGPSAWDDAVRRFEAQDDGGA